MKTEGVRTVWERYKFVVLILLIGAGLLLWPSAKTTAAADGEETETISWPAAVAQLQREMEAVLGQIQGVGTVHVLVTLESDGQRHLAQDTRLEYSGSAAAPESYVRTTETVMQEAGEGTQPLVTQQLYPAYRGALVVCQGGDRAEVRLCVTEAVSALTGLSSDRITVAKCP